MSDNFYRAFEDRYRGSREIIKARLAAYLPFITPLTNPERPATALDLGCGRGEWLEFLKENNFSASGVDLDERMLDACREHALQVERADALTSLRAVPANSLALISAFHLVEHIPFDLVQELISAALRALQPGGLLIMETPNSENLVVGASSFYLDPSHLRPVPSALLGFVTDYQGFVRHKVVRLQEARQLHTDAPIGLINVLDGVSPDYAIVAQKAAPQEILAAFDAPFQASYGIALGDLAERYEHQEEQRRSELHHGLARSAEALRQLESHTINSKVRIQGMDSELASLTQRLCAIEERLSHAEARAEQYAQQVIAIHASSSWRITAPLRAASGHAQRLRAAVREIRPRLWLKHRIKGTVLALARWVLRKPRLKQAARAVLLHFPGLNSRLLALNYSDPMQDELTPLVGDMSPRTVRMVSELKKSLKAKKN